MPSIAFILGLGRASSSGRAGSRSRFLVRLFPPISPGRLNGRVASMARLPEARKPWGVILALNEKVNQWKRGLYMASGPSVSVFGERAGVLEADRDWVRMTVAETCRNRVLQGLGLLLLLGGFLLLGRAYRDRAEVLGD